LPPLEVRRERLELADGDFVDLGWSGNTQGTGPLAILLHGLTGGFESKVFPGGHFYLTDQQEDVTRTIRDALKTYA